MTPSLVGVSLLIGAAAAFPVAVAYFQARNGWRTARRTEKNIDKARKAAWKQTRTLAKVAALALVAIWIAIRLAVHGHNTDRPVAPPSHEIPTSSPSAAQ